MTRKPNTLVCIYYEGTLDDGTPFDNRKEGDPLRVLLGSSMVPVGLERALCAMELNEERVVALSPEDGFGTYEPEAVFKVPLNTIPNSSDLPVGEYIQWYGKGNQRPAYAKVVEVKNDHAVIDLNHPLAGKTLQYWVKIVGEDNEQQLPHDNAAQKDA